MWERDPGSAEGDLYLEVEMIAERDSCCGAGEGSCRDVGGDPTVVANTVSIIA